MAEISATDAARNFADLLDAIEHRGEHFTIVRRGKAIAQLQPTAGSNGVDAKALLLRHQPDAHWRADLEAVRALVDVEDRE